MIETQLKLESELKEMCSLEFLSKFERDKEKSFSTTKSGTLIIKKIVCDFGYRIKRKFDEILSGSADRHTTAVKCLKDKDCYKIAFISLKAVLNILHKQPSIHAAVNAVADALDIEFSFEEFKKANKAYYNKVISDLSKRNADNRWKKTVLTYKFKEKEQLYLNRLSQSQKQHIGLFLLDILLNFEILETKYIYEHGKTKKFILPSELLLDTIENLNNRLKLFSCAYEPMVCKPKDWKGVFDGGYLIPSYKCRFIKHNDKEYLMRAEKFGLDNCFNAVNILQSTPWKINPEVFHIAKAMWDNNIALGGIPDRENKPVSNYPYPDIPKSELTEEQRHEVKTWKQNAAQIYRENIQKSSVRYSTARILHLAEKYKHFSKIYFPHQLDFRGRIYPIPILLNPQSCDISKGLLTFGEGKALDENGLKWLKIHLANCFGLNKSSYDERIEWVNSNTRLVYEYANDPLKCLDWTKADKPFQFLAACIEYKNYLNDPEGFKSTLPVYIDGTCNGLQLYSAMLKDEKAGKNVNLIDSERPCDIYDTVAKRLIELLHANEDKKSAQDWLSLGINRKLTKRSVMTLVYGATKFSCRDYVKDYLLDNYDINFLHKHFGETEPNPLKTVQKASFWLADIMWGAIKDCVPSAVLAMDYLRKAANLCAKKQQPIEWVTPLGMLVNQSYFSTKECRINTESAGSIKVYKYKGETKNYDIIKQVNGICPNFIHSLDSNCLMLWLLRCEEYGITRYTAVHDSYGVLASDMELAQSVLRQSFVEIFTAYDILDKFIEDITTVLSEEEKALLPPKPTQYNLDLKEVLHSKYFFN